jgi:hypothetical protein
VVSNLLLILSLGVGDDLRYEDGKNVFEQLCSEVKLGPIVSLLHDVQDVT